MSPSGPLQDNFEQYSTLSAQEFSFCDKNMKKIPVIYMLLLNKLTKLSGWLILGVGLIFFRGGGGGIATVFLVVRIFL